MPATDERAPVSDLLRTAAEYGIEIRPGWLPRTAYYVYRCIYEAIHASVPEPTRVAAALDTTIALCAERTGRRLVPSSMRDLTGLIGRCFEAHGIPAREVGHTVTSLAVVCRGGLQAPTLRAVERELRNKRIRQEFTGSNHAALARAYRLSTAQVYNVLGAAGRENARHAHSTQ